MTEVIVTALAGLAVAAALWGMARHQLYLYRVNRRLRGIAKIRRGERGHVTGGVLLFVWCVALLALGLTYMTLYLAEDADDTIRDRIDALEERPYTETSSIQITPTP